VRLDPFTAPFLHAVGDDLQATVEVHADPLRIDHVWITMDVGRAKRLTVSINTFSRRNYDAGFDARVQVGVRKEPWTLLPGRGAAEHAGFDYADEERVSNIFYEHYTREALEEFLLLTTREAILLEAWGSPYYRRRGQPGLHQIHSRRASCAVAEDIRNRDGALRFYFADHSSVLCLFKFCGQP
jgi:hypothetical protein